MNPTFTRIRRWMKKWTVIRGLFEEICRITSSHCISPNCLIMNSSPDFFSPRCYQSLRSTGRIRTLQRKKWKIFMHHPHYVLMLPRFLALPARFSTFSAICTGKLGTLSLVSTNLACHAFYITYTQFFRGWSPMHDFFIQEEERAKLTLSNAL